MPRWSDGSTRVGGTAWLAIAAVAIPHPRLGPIEILFLLAPRVVVPGRLSRPPRAARRDLPRVVRTSGAGETSTGCRGSRAMPTTALPAAFGPVICWVRLATNRSPAHATGG